MRYRGTTGSCVTHWSQQPNCLVSEPNNRAVQCRDTSAAPQATGCCNFQTQVLQLRAGSPHSFFEVGLSAYLFISTARIARICCCGVSRLLSVKNRKRTLQNFVWSVLFERGSSCNVGKRGRTYNENGRISFLVFILKLGCPWIQLDQCDWTTEK